MDAKARLANLLDRIVECEAERRVALTKRDDASADNWEFRREQARREALALLDTEPVPPPQPAGPVTSEGAATAYLRGVGVFGQSEASTTNTRHALDAAMPLLARDHGLLTPAEVERRAREWWRRGGGGFSGLVTALTAPADTREGVK